MYEHRSIAIILPAWNEAGKIGRAVTRMPRALVDVVLVADDGSTDGTAEEAERAGAQVLRHDRNQGVGAAIRTGIEWAQAHDIALTGIMAGDDQDDPREIVLLARSIVENGADFVQGSRYVKGGRRLNQPLSRTTMTRGYSVLFSLCVLRPVTDATHGFKTVPPGGPRVNNFAPAVAGPLRARAVPAVRGDPPPAPRRRDPG